MEEHNQYYLAKSKDLLEMPASQDFEFSQANLLKTSKDLYIKEVFNVTNQETSSLKGHKIGITNATAPNTALNLSDFFVVVPSVVVSKTITLPSATNAGIGKVYIIKDISGSASATTITISPQTGETINGDTSTSINTNYGFVGLFTNGVNWFTS